MYKIPLSVPSIKGNEWQYVKECLDTEWVSSAGKYVDLFEEKIAEYTGAKYAVACVNGTAALQVALRVAGVQPNEEVIVPTITFIASVNAIVYNGASPVFMDADNYYNIDIAKTLQFFRKETVFKNGSTYNKRTKRRIAALLPVHVFGNAVDIEVLLSLCEARNIPIIEDAAESLGTRYTNSSLKGWHTGTIGLMGCLSFNGNKIITTGGGGMILTNDNKLAEMARYLTTQAKDDPIRYIHHEVGYNYRLTNIQAAIGVAQLEQLTGFLDKKREIFHHYQTAFNDLDSLTIANVPDYAENNHWMSLLQINSETYSEDRERLMQRLEKTGIQTRPVWTLNHLQKPYKNCQTYQIEKAEQLVINSLCLPSSSQLSDEDLNKVINTING